MKKVSIIPVVTIISATFLFYRFNPGPNGIIDLYAQRLQSPMFTGFLTLSGFLLTLATFIIIRLKEGLYDSSLYRSRLKELRSINPGLSAYGPLKRLSILLATNVICAFTTSILQFSLGFVRSKLVVAFCLGVGFGTISLALVTFFQELEDAAKSEKAT
jgi:hypothetical protein